MREKTYKKRYPMFLGVSLLLFMCIPVVGGIIYVDDDAEGGNNGTSWTDAYHSLQDALADANKAEKPVEIRVAQGIYTPDRGAGITRGDNLATFRLDSGVAIKGGFAGIVGIDPDARVIRIYETILSGDLNGDDAGFINPEDLGIEPTRAENSGMIMTTNDVDETAILDGVTVTAGGVGIVNDDGNPTVMSCTFTCLIAGVDNHDSDSRITNCTFNGTSLFAIGQQGGNLVLTNCRFSNSAGWAAVYSSFHSEMTLSNCTFTLCSSAAIDCPAGQNLRLYDCEFINNISSRAVVNAGGEEEFLVNNCTFAGNLNDGIDHNFGRMVVTNSLFVGNRGRAIKTIREYVTVRNCTFSNNTSNFDGSALYLWRKARVSECIFWNNSSPFIREGYNTPAIVEYCNIQGGWPGQGNIDVDPCFVEPGYWDSKGTPDDTDDDFLVDGDYHLRSQAGRWDPVRNAWVKDDVTSLCIDAGDPNGPMGTEPFPNGGRVNIGAYGAAERASKSYFAEPVCQTVIAGDINGDCVVNFGDLAILASHWMMSDEDFVNKPPTVRLVEPQDGDQIVWPGPTRFRAEADDIDGEIHSVSFNVQYKSKNGTSTHGFGATDGTDGWKKEYYWPNNPGQWTVWAEARDNEGAISVSPEIVITLQSP